MHFIVFVFFFVGGGGEDVRFANSPDWSLSLAFKTSVMASNEQHQPVT